MLHIFCGLKLPVTRQQVPLLHVTMENINSMEHDIPVYYRQTPVELQ